MSHENSSKEDAKIIPFQTREEPDEDPVTDIEYDGDDLSSDPEADTGPIEMLPIERHPELRVRIAALLAQLRMRGAENIRWKNQIINNLENQAGRMADGGTPHDDIVEYVRNEVVRFQRNDGNVIEGDNDEE